MHSSQWPACRAILCTAPVKPSQNQSLSGPPFTPFLMRSTSKSLPAVSNLPTVCTPFSSQSNTLPCLSFTAAFSVCQIALSHFLLAAEFCPLYSMSISMTLSQYHSLLPESGGSSVTYVFPLRYITDKVFKQHALSCLAEFQVSGS